MQSFSSPSELIDVFLDGEHSGTERAVLFSALGSNTDLQIEFEEALRIRTAALTDAALTMPPPDLTSSLMSRAGFGAAVIEAASPMAMATATAGQSFLASVGTSLSSAFASFGIPFVTAIIGFFAGINYPGTGTVSVRNPSSATAPSLNGYNDNTSRTQDGSLSSTIQLPASSQAYGSYDPAQQQQDLVTNRDGAFPNNHSIPSVASQSAMADGVLESTRRAGNNVDELNVGFGFGSGSGSGYGSGSGSDSGTESGLSTADRTTTSTELSNGKNGSTGTIVILEPSNNRDSEQGSTALTALPYTIRTQLTSVTYSVPDYEIPVSQISSLAIPSVSTLELSIRGTRGIQQTLDSLVNRADAVNMGNVGIGIRYAVSPNLQVLLEGGRESFATYVYDNTSGPLPYRVQQNIIWAAAGARGVVDVLSEDFHTALFGQVLVGASDVGALIRPMAGLQWKPDKRVTLFGGVEQLFLQTKAQGTTGTGSKLSFSYGLSLNF